MDGSENVLIHKWRPSCVITEGALLWALDTLHLKLKGFIHRELTRKWDKFCEFIYAYAEISVDS